MYLGSCTGTYIYLSKQNLQPPLRVYVPERIHYGPRRPAEIKTSAETSYKNTETKKTQPSKVTTNGKPPTDQKNRPKYWKTGSVKSFNKNNVAPLIKPKPDNSECASSEASPTVQGVPLPKGQKKHLPKQNRSSLYRLVLNSYPRISNIRTVRSEIRKHVKLLFQSEEPYCHNLKCKRRKKLHRVCLNNRKNPELLPLRKKLIRDLHFAFSKEEFDRGNHINDLEEIIQLQNTGWRLRQEKALARMLFRKPSGYLSHRRTSQEAQFIWSQWKALDDVMTVFERQLSCLQPLYTLKDLTLRIQEFPIPQEWRKEGSSSDLPVDIWLILPLPLPTWKEILEVYTELSPFYDNYAVDHFDEEYKILQKSREDRLNRVLKRRDIFKVRQLCRLGCCTNNREATWTLLLRNRDKEKQRFKDLLEDFVRYELFLDWVMMKSVVDTVGNSDQFFNFVPLTQQVLQLFQRDENILKQLDVGIQTQPLVTFANHTHPKPHPSLFYPPNGVVPFHEFPMYAAPLAYVCMKTKSAYFLFSELYGRYFQYLHNLSLHPQGIVSLYAVFENLLFVKEPDLLQHLKGTLNISPAEFVVPWMTMAFSGFLEVDQLLLLWDRIVGFNDLRILSLLSLGVFVIRRNALLKAKNHRDVSVMLSDILSVEIVPLLQLVLFT